MIERLQLPGRPASPLYSPLVRWNGLLFVTGQVARDAQGAIVGAGDFARQADQVFANIANVLSVGGATLADLLMITVYVTDARYRNGFREATARHLASHLPASTLVTVAGLSEPEFLIEIDAIAADPRAAAVAKV
jgi:2-iminobutanoate/2-iminopropanoate deaminase